MAADPGASHAKKGAPGAVTRDLLQKAYAYARHELDASLDELWPEPVDTSKLTIGDPMPAGRPTMANRRILVAHIADLMRLLGTEVVAGPPVDPGPAGATVRRRKIEY